MDMKNKVVYKNNVSHLIVRYADAISDPRLGLADNNGRKFLVNGIYAEKECHVQKGLDVSNPDFVVWKSDCDGKVPILEVGVGGAEAATFTQEAKQDRHKHLVGTEFYTVLEGRMKIRIDDKEIELNARDEAIILPGTVHEIISKNSNFVTRGHFIDCYGVDDKYMEVDGKWKLVKDIK